MVAFIPFSRLEDRKFGFLLRNKTISLNICIDVREVFNAKVTSINITLTSMTTMSAMFALTDITTTLVTHVVYESVALLLDVTILLFPPLHHHCHCHHMLIIIQIVRESVWSSLDSTPGSGTELLTLAKTSNLSDLQVRISYFFISS